MSMESKHPMRRSLSRRRFLGLLASSTAGTAVLAACATTAPTAAPLGPAATPTTALVVTGPKRGGTLSYGTSQVGVIPTFLPWRALSSAQQAHWIFCYSCLVRRDKDLNYQPDLAESWEVSEDGKTWTFHLRKGVKWHDGEDFTADDVAFTYRAALLPQAGSTMSAMIPVVGAKAFQDGTVDSVEGIKVVDDHTIQFVLDAPNAAILSSVFAVLWIAPEHPFKDEPDPAKWETLPVSTEKPIGTGPFVFKEYIPDQYTIMEANENYFRGRPYIDQYAVRWYGDVNVLYIALEKGEFDFTSVGPNADQLKVLQGMQNITMSQFVSKLASPFLSMSWTRPAFTDKRVRQAAMYAIDRKTIAEQVYGGTRLPALVSYWHAPWALSNKLNDYPYDPEKAKQLLAEANYDTSQEWELIWFGAQLPDDLPIIQQQLEAVGIKTKLVQLERARIMDTFYGESNYDISYLGGYGGLEPWGARIELACDAFFPAGWNSPHFCNEEMDQILINGPAEVDPEKRAAMYKRGSEIFNEYLPYLPLFNPVGYWVFNKRVKEWENTVSGGLVTGIGEFYGQWDWYIDEAT